MRVRISCLLAMMLAGCQLNQSLTHTNQDDVDVNKPQQVVDKTMAPVKTTHAKTVVEPKVITPQEQQDVWQRIAMQLEMTVPQDQTVDYYRKWYLKHPGHLKLVAERAQPFLFLITEKVEERGLPLELTLLPIVESAFDAFAYSHGSAAGLWQFIPATGKMFGLKQNFWYDGRRDVDAATDAALDYLTSLGKQFNGDWEQAIAAYNSGGGRVASAIRKNQKLGKPTDFFSLDLPKETSSYVPKLLALADIIAHKDKYGIDIPEIPNKPVLQLVDPEEQLDLAIAAKYAGINVKELQSYNPAYNQWATSPNGPHQLLLPVDSVEPFLAKIETHRGEGMKLVRYKVQSGDTLSVIASKHSTTTKVIKTANNLSDNTIRIGQYLMIPNSVKDEKAYVLSATNRLAKTQSTSRGKYKQTHTVRNGDSLWTIANKNNVSYTSLAKWNGMGPKDTLRVGQKLVIWKNSTNGAIIRTVVYQVRNGDTLSDIADKFRVKTTDIVEWNDLSNPKYLKPGESLKLYVDVTKVSV